MVAAPEITKATQVDEQPAKDDISSLKQATKLVNGQTHAETVATEQQQQTAQADTNAQPQLTSDGQLNNGADGSSLQVNGASSGDQNGEQSEPGSADPAVNLPPVDVARNIPCRYFPLGQCKYGEKCIFSHGIAGVAGSPGVPSVAEDKPAARAQADELGFYAPQGVEYGHQMPMYYGGMPEQGFDYGYQPAYPVQPGFYPFPAPFQMYQYQQGMAPQAYYQPVPMMHPMQQQQQQQQQSQHQQTATVNGSHVPSESPASAASPTSPNEHLRPSSTAPEMSSYSSSPSTQAGPAVAQQMQPAPAHGEFAFAGAMSPASPYGADGVPLPGAPQQRQDRAPSLHTFFQTSAPTPSTSVPALVQGINGAHFGGNNKGAPRVNGVVRRNNVMGSMSASFAGRPKPRFPPGTPKPACSFFESNRCKYRDGCSFQHLLPDGTDARSLGLNWAGVDGRTDNLEERGGLPPAWIANQRQAKLNMKNQNHNGGGFSARDNRPARTRYEDNSQGEDKAAASGDVQSAKADPSASQQASSLGAAALTNGRIPPGGAPQLVAAINGLTRRIPPISSNNHHNHNNNSNNGGNSSGQHNASSSARQQQPAQRVPSGADFPALSSAPASRPSSPGVPDIATPVPAAKASDQAEQTSAAALSPTDEKEYVMVSHEDATPSTSTTEATAASPAAPAADESQSTASAAAAPIAAPAARIMGSFASAAARGASVPAPERPRRQPVATKPAPTKDASDETKDAASTPAQPANAGGKNDKTKKSGASNKNSVSTSSTNAKSSARQAPAAVKASA
ncbi:hypothetical protein OIO90_000993 [Microbotryomycetes sp. JL221]|nr:hypothetical protein OIO90_000993 [Microbotryomycetes sp. JL221]